MQASIVNDVKNKGTFQLMTGEEQAFNTLKQSGLDDASIQDIIVKRRGITANKSMEPVVETPKVELPKTDHPFNGMSKAEMLRDAYNRGVTDVKELDNLEALYDKLVAPSEEFTVSEDQLQTMSYERKQQVKQQLKLEATTKAMALATEGERNGVMSSIGVFESGQELIDLLESGVETGPIAGLQRGGAKIFGLPIVPGSRALGSSTAEEDRFDALTTLYTANFIKAISGAQVSNEEREFLMKALPNESKQEQQNIQGIKVVSEWLNNRYANSVGMDFSLLLPEEGNSDPLKLMNGSSVSTENPLGI